MTVAGSPSARVLVLEHPGQLERPVGGQRQLEQRAGEAAARLDRRDQAAAGHVEPPQRALEVVQDLVGEPVVLAAEQQLVVGEDQGRVAFGAEDPGAELGLVGAQVQDQVVELTGHRERPELRALSGCLGDIGGRVVMRAFYRYVDPARVAVQAGFHVVVPDGVVVGGLGERGQLDAGRVLRAAGAARQLGGPLGHGLVPPRARHGLVDQAPLHGLLAPDALGLGGEVVGQVPPHVPLVGHPGQPAGARQHPEQRQLGQRHRRGPVVDQHDVLTGQRQLVPAARGGAVHRGQVGLAGVRGGVLDAVSRLVGELAEVHLPAVRRGGEHADVRPGAEDLRLAAGDDDGAHLGMLEAQPLHRVVQLDVHAEVVGVQLQLVARHQAALLVDVHRQGGDRPVGRQPPVLVPVRADAEVDPFGVYRFCLYRLGHGTVLPADASYSTKLEFNVKSS